MLCISIVSILETYLVSLVKAFNAKPFRPVKLVDKVRVLNDQHALSFRLLEHVRKPQVIFLAKAIFTISRKIGIIRRVEKNKITLTRAFST